MNLLNKDLLGIDVIKTDERKTLVIDNHSSTYPIYKIKIDKLYYNDQNDRISTWISQYKDKINISNLEEYNNTIHKFITESNKGAIDKTTNNINILGQQEPGVVLSEGRIIDGNRRFTCLRNIQHDTQNTQYFKSIILVNRDIKEDAKQIKLLELQLQHGVDEKVAYNPIDRLVGLYHDIVETNLLTIKEYAKSVNETERKIKDDVDCAILLSEFLEFINSPHKFYIARTLNLVDPLKGLNNALKKIKNLEDRENFKNTIFCNFLLQPQGDMTRYIRNFSKIASDKARLVELIDEQMPIVEKICEKLSKYEEITEKDISTLKDNDTLRNKLHHSTEKALIKVNGELLRSLPKDQLIKANDLIDLVDINIFSKLSSDKKEEILDEIDSIEQKLEFLKENLDV